MEGDVPEETHPAVHVLNEMLDRGEITRETHEALNEKFTKLHNAFTRSCDTEQRLMRQARNLTKELKEQKGTIEQSASHEQAHRNDLLTMRQSVANVRSELETTLEQISATGENTKFKRHELDKLEEKVAKAQQEQTARLDPQKRKMQQENANIEEEIHLKRKHIDSLVKEKKELVERGAKCDRQLAELDASKKIANQRVLEVGSLPVKIRAKIGNTEASLSGLLSEERQALAKFTDIESKITAAVGKLHDTEVAYQHVTVDIDGMNDVSFQKTREYEAIRVEIAEQVGLKKQLDFENMGLVKAMHEHNAVITGYDQRMDQIRKENVRKTAEMRKMDEALARLELERCTMESQLVSLQKVVKEEEKFVLSRNAEFERTEAATVSIRKALLTAENVTAEVKSYVKEEMKQVDGKQLTVDSLKEKERETSRELQQAVIFRNNKAREMTSLKRKVQSVKELAAEQHLRNLDQARALEVLMEQCAESDQLYEKVKDDRNRYINTIQTSQQIVVELNEKIKLLKGGVDVFQVEYARAEVDVKLQKNELAEAWKRREATKCDLRKAEEEYRALEKEVDRQANETSRMRRELQRVESQINNEQERYTMQADDCANVQRMLIDKQDELCLIYEQYNRHEEIMKQGEQELRNRDEELRRLHVQLVDFIRQIEIQQRKIPQVKKCDAEIDELASQIMREKKDVEQLTTRLEVPDKRERKRNYCGRDVSVKELETKIVQYEQRIKAKEQQRMESRILLNDVEMRLDKIKESTAKELSTPGRSVERSGNARAEAMANRRKKMAALSEMAVYQAHVGDDREKTETVKRRIATAESRTARGKGFDEKADKEVRNYRRDIMTASGGRRRPLYEDDEDEAERQGRAKFDAYPTADGLSRPYGAFPVFQPGTPSANLRFYKKEGERPIVL